METKILEEFIEELKQIVPDNNASYNPNLTRSQVFVIDEIIKMAKQKVLTQQNEYNASFDALIKLINSQKAVKSWAIHKGNNTLIGELKEELGLYDLEIFNRCLSQISECKDMFESDAKFEHDKRDYKTIFIKLKNK